jgi:tripartite-type tricarboxylate transporter receptor subunit TctC
MIRFALLARRAAAVSISSLLIASAAAANDSECLAAGEYPACPIKIVVTYPPGGTLDVVARLLGPKLRELLKQEVIIEHRGGASGMTGEAVVAKAKPDGYTFMLDASNHSQNPALYRHMSFDTLKDFAPVSLLLRVPNVLVVPPNSQIKTEADLIKLGQAALPSQTLYFASAGIGSAQHLGGELFNLLAGTHLEHFPYWGSGPAMIDVMTGQMPVMFASMASSWPHIRDGELRAIAVGSSTRSPIAPDLPTIAEAGVPGYESYEWNAVFAPAGTPSKIIDKVWQALVTALKDHDIATTLASLGVEIVGSTPAELDTFRRSELAKWHKLVKDAHLPQY